MFMFDNGQYVQLLCIVIYFIFVIVNAVMLNKMLREINILYFNIKILRDLLITYMDYQDLFEEIEDREAEIEDKEAEIEKMIERENELRDAEDYEEWRDG